MISIWGPETFRVTSDLLSQAAATGQQPRAGERPAVRPNPAPIGELIAARPGPAPSPTEDATAGHRRPEQAWYGTYIGPSQARQLLSGGDRGQQPRPARPFMPQSLTALPPSLPNVQHTPTTPGQRGRSSSAWPEDSSGLARPSHQITTGPGINQGYASRKAVPPGAGTGVEASAPASSTRLTRTSASLLHDLIRPEYDLGTQDGSSGIAPVLMQQGMPHLLPPKANITQLLFKGRLLLSCEGGRILVRTASVIAPMNNA